MAVRSWSIPLAGLFLAAGLSRATAASPTYDFSGLPVGGGPPTWVSNANPMIADPPGDLTNGGFETGTLAGWTEVDQAGGTGSWVTYSGTTAPLSGQVIAAPPEGMFAATSDQTGPGSHILYQDLALAAGPQPRLDFFVYYTNAAGAFSTPATLDYTVSPNQQYRIDLIKPTAAVNSVAPADILATIFQTMVGDPATKPPTLIQFDLTPFAGTTVRLRFAEVDNQGVFDASVDAFACPSAPASGCQAAAAHKAQLALGSGKLSWKWTSSGTVATADFGTPATTTDYLLCVYDMTGLKQSAQAQADRMCGTKPCWKAVSTKGFKYGDKAGTPDGVTKVQLKSGGVGKGKIGVKGGGANLLLPTLPLTTPVKAQLLRSDSSSLCWEATYSTPTTNTASGFKAKSD